MRGTILIILCLISVLFISGCTVNPELEKKYFSVIGEGTIEEKEVEIPDVIVIDNIKIPALAGGKVKPSREVDIIVTLKNRDVNKPITLTYAGISDPGIFTCIDCGRNGETSISPGQLKTFSFTVKAPSNDGTIAYSGHLEFSAKYRYKSTRLATITFIGKDDYMDYLESGGKVSVSIINIPSDGPVELDLDISNIHQPVVVDGGVMSSKLQSSEKNSELVNKITDSFFGKIVFAADCSAGDTNWGKASNYGCAGNDKRCFGGNCIQCDGKMVNGLCWYEGLNSNNDCDQICLNEGGVYNNCNWVDSNSCVACKNFHPSASCASGSWKYAPFYDPVTNFCHNAIPDCGAEIPDPFDKNSARICACNGDKIVSSDPEKCSYECLTISDCLAKFGTNEGQKNCNIGYICCNTPCLHDCVTTYSCAAKLGTNEGSHGCTGSNICCKPLGDGTGCKCSDGTSCNQCTSSKPRYCDSTGNIIDKCGTCECPSDKPNCQSDGSCTSSGGGSGGGGNPSSSYEDKGEHQIYMEVLNKGSGEIDVIDTGNLDISFEDMTLEVCSEEFGGEGCGGTATFNNEPIVVRGSNPFRYYFSFTPNTNIIGSNSITTTKKVEISAEYIYRLPQTIEILVSPRAEI
ncbi:MAG: hypothetical protein DRP06_00255 [Candidatus Aenigmatarchaeota archaeon]|nr:MAG: hypothetical protein DRP06_00255 [Candidatus Aenigmarchaeota archaeon]